MFQIKICGVTRVEDVAHALHAGAEAIGLNFYRDGKRCLTPGGAIEIADAVGARAAKVGVFVNSPVAEVDALRARLRLDWIQLHGDEPVEFMAQLPLEAKIMRVYRMGVVTLDEVASDLAAARAAGRLPDALMLDAAQVGSYGGTGVTVNWDLAAGLAPLLDSRGLPELPWVLAGGLTPANVADAISRAKPTAVDVASGVESSPGIKQADLVRQFVANARDAFRDLA